MTEAQAVERKSFETFTKAIDDRTVTGVASVFGNVDSYGDIVHKGAFKKTLKEGLGKVKHLWMHDAFNPPTATIKGMREISREELPEELLAKYPDASGGLEVSRSYLRTARGDEILEGIREKAITQMSFGYDPVKFDFDETDTQEKGVTLVRNLREVRLWDISDVNWGANQATVASKAFAPFLTAYQEKMEPAQFELFQQLATTAETALSPDLLKAGRVLSSRNLERLKAALDVLSEILLTAEPQEDEESAKALTEQVMRQLSIYERDPIYLSVR